MMGRSVRLETNSGKLLAGAIHALRGYPAVDAAPRFTWRVVCQAAPDAAPPWPMRSGFSEPGLRYIAFGQTSFIAVDLDHAEAVAYISDGLAEDTSGLISPFLDNLFSLSAGSFGLMSIFAACVAKGGDSILVAGSPNAGKTSVCYLAAIRHGFTFEADRAVFLEESGVRLRAWGDFWPAAFRPDAVNHYPELHSQTRLFRHVAADYLYLEKEPLQRWPLRPTTPKCCVFLQRGRQTTPSLRAVPAGEFERRIQRIETFQDDLRFDAQRDRVLRSLSRLPCYDLMYGEAPAEAAALLPDLLDRC
jgi:hypothetical protein